jgi:hypothetical protein
VVDAPAPDVQSPNPIEDPPAPIDSPAPVTPTNSPEPDSTDTILVALVGVQFMILGFYGFTVVAPQLLATQPTQALQKTEDLESLIKVKRKNRFK